jgi:hypothetical protein
MKKLDLFSTFFKKISYICSSAKEKPFIFAVPNREVKTSSEGKGKDL